MPSMPHKIQVKFTVLALLTGSFILGCGEDAPPFTSIDPKQRMMVREAIRSTFDEMMANHFETTQSQLGLSEQIRTTPTKVQWALIDDFGERFDIGWSSSIQLTRTTPVRIALIDESFDVDAPGLKHAFDVESGVNIMEEGKPLWSAHRDGFHHGNLVASIIANRPATDVSPLGVWAGDGIEIIPIVAAGGHGPAWRTPRSNPEMIHSALKHAILAGVDIINISAGIDVSRSDLMRLSEDPIWDQLEAAGIPVICAAGNDGRDIDINPIFPASVPRVNIIAVMGIGPTGQASKRQIDSGDWVLGTNYGKKSVSVAAPAELIEVEARPNRPELVNGTSVAAAYVTAALAVNSRMRVKRVQGLENQCRSAGMIQLPDPR